MRIRGWVIKGLPNDSFSIDMFQMFDEASTGFPGALGRQLTLTQSSRQRSTVYAGAYDDYH